MKRSRFSEEQIIALLKEQEAGMPTANVAARLQPLPAPLEPREQNPSRDRGRIERQTVLGACPQYGCCHHVQRWASKRPKALLIDGRNLGLRPGLIAMSGLQTLGRGDKDDRAGHRERGRWNGLRLGPLPSKRGGAQQ
jgi:hypothetical protein